MSRSTPKDDAVTADIRLKKQHIFGLVVLVVVLYAILPQIKEFHASIHLLTHIQPYWLLLALGASLATYIMAAGVYWFLARKPLHFRRTVEIQLASMFANRLLPAGVGAISVNYSYLRKHRHTTTEASAVIAVNNALGIIGNIILVGGVLLLQRNAVPTLHYTIKAPIYWLVGIVTVGIVIIIAWGTQLRHRLYRFAFGTLKDIVHYRNHLFRLGLALGCSILITSLYSFCLWSSARSVGIYLGYGQALVVTAIGVAGATITPTPGGLVGAEASLLLGLVAFGVVSSSALAVVLVYRLLTYWLALALGSGAFFWSRHQGSL